LGATQLTGEKNGSKRHLLVEGHGVPLSILVTGANRHDVTQLAAVLDAKVVKPKGRCRQYLCADKAYHGQPAQEAIVARRYIPKVRRRGEEIDQKKRIPGYKPRRWVVEVTHSWFNRFRKLLVRYEKYADSYLALCHLAAAIICWRKVAPIYG
jgi:transposase